MKSKKNYDDFNEDSIIKSSSNNQSEDYSKYSNNKQKIFLPENIDKIQNSVESEIKISNAFEDKQKFNNYTNELKNSNPSEEKQKLNDFSRTFKSSTDEKQKSSDNNDKKPKIIEEDSNYITEKEIRKSQKSEQKENSDQEYEEEEEESYESEEEDSNEHNEKKEGKDNLSYEEGEYEEESGSYEDSEQDDESDESWEKSKKSSKKKHTHKIEIKRKNKIRKVRIIKKQKKKNLNESDESKQIEDEQQNIDSLFPNEELSKIQTPFTIDIVKLADECFDIYQVTIKNRNFRLIDINEVQSLLDVIGIKKNLYEIRNSIFDLKKNTKFRVDEKYTKQNFLDIVDYFRYYRIDDKLLAEVYRSIDEQFDGFLTFEDIQNISRVNNLHFSNDEINDILNFFELEDVVKCEMQNKIYNPSEKKFFNFEKFCRLYYQG